MTVADNVVLSTNIGTGSTLRTLSDGTEEWEVAAMAYVTTLSPGANVLQVVTAAFGLPVAQQGTWTVGVSGSVACTGTFFQTTQPVSGTFWQATQPISGTITANAGANLNTSLLALETGGNLASIAAHTPALGQQLAAASTPVVLTAIQLAALTPLTTLPTVTTVTTVSAVTSITNALPAGTNLLGTVSCSDETSTIYEGTTALTPIMTSFNLSASGPTQIVAATAGKKIRVLRYSVDFNSTVNFNFQSHTTTSTASGIKFGIANKTAGGAYCPLGIMQTVAGEALDGNLSGTGTVSGELTYVLA